MNALLNRRQLLGKAAALAALPFLKLFEEIYQRHARNPKEFWTPYPFPSIAVDDPAFNPLTANCWGGPSQVLTVLRAPRWMEYYGHSASRVVLTWPGDELKGEWWRPMQPYASRVLLKDISERSHSEPVRSPANGPEPIRSSSNRSKPVRCHLSAAKNPGISLRAGSAKSLTVNSAKHPVIC